MATTTDLVASVRDATHQVYADGTGPVTDAAILRWANEEYPIVRRMLAGMIPDWFASKSAALVVASGAEEIDVSGVASLDLIFEVQRLYGLVYREVPAAGPDPEGGRVLTWRRRGMSGAGTAVELYPVSLAPGTYKLRYLATAAALSGGAPILLPAGGERVLVESVSARVLDKLERDYAARLRERDRALKEFGSGFQSGGYVIQSARR